MQYGLINLAIVPLREKAAHSSQKVSQLLFGEGFTVLETENGWLKIKTENDSYEGYIQATQSVLVEENVYEKYLLKTVLLTYEPVTIISKKSDNSLLYLPAGSQIVGLENNEFVLGSTMFQLQNQLQPKANSLIDFANTYLNTPYLWGGRTHFGIDCSGFAQAVYRSQNIQLKRDAWQQAEQGQIVDFLQAALPGDLAFFDNEAGRIVHVGIMLNNEQIIHASGNVKIDRIDDQGIYSAEQKKYTHQLRIIKRFF
ncbi:MAG: C40 family peptidase [Janthinobacterium lividum]